MINTFDIEEDLGKTIDGSDKVIAIIADPKNWDHHREHMLRLAHMRYGQRKRFKIYDHKFSVGDTTVMFFDPAALNKNANRIKGMQFSKVYIHETAAINGPARVKLLAQIR